MGNLKPRRIQVNDYRDAGGHCGWHIDSDSCPCYQAALVLQIAEGYEGGEMKMETPHSKECTTHLACGEVLLLEGTTPHMVAPLISGRRTTICSFWSEQSDGRPPAREGSSRLLARYPHLQTSKLASPPASTTEKAS